MTSTSSFGVSQISLQFDLNRDIDGATQDVQAAINAAAGVLPKNLPYPPTYAKVNPADAPVLTLAMTSETSPLRAMSDLADTMMAQRLAQISGVGRVSILGGIETRCARAGGPRPARRLRHFDGRPAQRNCRRKCVRPQGLTRRRAAGLHHRS